MRQHNKLIIHTDRQLGSMSRDKLVTAAIRQLFLLSNIPRHASDICPNIMGDGYKAMNKLG